MKYILFSYFLFASLGAFSQEFRPLIDPSIACFYSNPNNPLSSQTNPFFIVETMPEPKIPFSSIEKFLQKKIDIGKKVEDRIIFQSLVNCEGKAGDYQLLVCNLESATICKQVLEVFQEGIEWKPGIQRGKAVDVLLRISVEIENGKFEVKII
jgi:hypothetical protein